MKKKFLSLVLVLTVVCSTLVSLGITASAASITGSYQYTYYAGCDSSMGTLLVRDNCTVDGHSMIKNIGNNWSCSTSTGLIFYAKANEGYEFKGFYVTENNGTTRLEEGETTFVDLAGLSDIPVHDKAYIFKFSSLSSLKVEAKFERIVNEENSVAKIGNTYYATLKEAIDVAGVGEIVTLLADVSIGDVYAISIATNDNLIVDLGGHTVTYTGKYAALMNSGGTCTIQNGNIVTAASAQFATATGNVCITNLKNVNITHNGTNKAVTAENSGTITTLDNCTVTTTVDGASAFAVYNGGVITVNGGEYNGELSVLDTDKNSQIIINGGTFSVAPGSEFLAEGVNVYQLANGKYVVTSAVCKIGDKYYATLQDAIDAVPADKTQTTIELLCDVKVSKKKDGSTFALSISVNQNIVLDLGGHTIEGTDTDTGGVISSYGSLTLKNGKIKSYMGACIVSFLNAQSECSLTLQDLEIVHDYATADGITILSQIPLTIDDSIKITSSENLFSTSGQGTVTVNGGVFTKDPSAYVAAGRHVYQLDDGTYKVTEAVCRIGDTYYNTIDEAIAAAPEGTNTTIDLLCDITKTDGGQGDAIVYLRASANKVITLNMNGHTLKNTAGLVIAVGSSNTLTVNDGTCISEKDSTASIMAATGGVCTLEDVYVKGSGSALASYYSNASITANNSSIDGDILINSGIIVLTNCATTVDPTPYTTGTVRRGGAENKYYIDAVAAIGEKGYATLGAACAAAGENDTVYLLCDYQDDKLNISGKSVKVNLGGYTLSRPANNEAVFAIANGGSLELENGILDGRNAVTSNNMVTANDASAFKATDVTFQNAQARWGTIFAGDTSSIELIRCTIKDNTAANGERACGSAIHAYGVVKLTDCIIKDNTETLAMTNAESISSALHLKSSVTLYLSGNNFIYDNKLLNGAQANIALTADKENTAKTVIYVTGSLAGSKIGVTENAWSNPIAAGNGYTLTEADAACFVDDAGIENTKLTNNTVIFAALDENTAFKTTTDSGYYGEYQAPESGIIAFNSFFKNYEKANISKFGLYLYVTGGTKVNVEATTAEDLKNASGLFYTTVTDIPPENFGTSVFAMPYVIIDGVVYYGSDVSATVNGNKWLGNNE